MDETVDVMDRSKLKITLEIDLGREAPVIASGIPGDITKEELARIERVLLAWVELNEALRPPPSPLHPRQKERRNENQNNS